MHSLPQWSDSFDEVVSDLIPITSLNKSGTHKQSRLLLCYVTKFKDGIRYLETSINMSNVSRKLITRQVTLCKSKRQRSSVQPALGQVYLQQRYFSKISIFSSLLFSQCLTVHIRIYFMKMSFSLRFLSPYYKNGI